MRVGIDATVLHGRYTGVARAVAGLIRALAASDDEHEYFLYCGKALPPVRELPENFRWRPLSFDVGSRWRVARWQQRELDERAKKDRLALLHSPAYVGPTRGTVPLVLTIYDLHAFTHPELCSRLNRWHYGLVMPRAARRASQVIVPSGAVGQVVTKRLLVREERVHTVPLAVDSHFRHIDEPDPLVNVREALGLPERFLLFVGNVEPRKGVPLLIEAFARARQRAKIPHQLVIAGKPGVGYRSVKRRIQALGIEGAVIELGFVGDEILPHLYNLSEAVVCPAPWEGFGFPALEAMSCGTPVIASNSGALPELCGEAATFYTAGSAAALSEAIEALTEDEAKRHALRQAGLTRAEAFSWAAAAQQTLAIYGDAAHG